MEKGEQVQKQQRDLWKLQTPHLGICWTICAYFKSHVLVSRVEAIQITKQPPHLSSALQSNEAKLVSNVTGYFMPVAWMAWLMHLLLEIIFKVEL